MKDQKTLNWKHAVIIGIFTALGSIGGKFAFSYFSTGSIMEASHIDKALITVAEAMNQNLPIMLDRHTRLDTTFALPENRFTYQYTMVGIDPTTVNVEEFVAAMRPKLIAQYQTNQDMEGFRKMNVGLMYAYRTEAGDVLVQIEISPSDFENE